MSILYEEKIAKRFAKIKPADFDFWAELDSALATAFFGKKKDNPATVKNYDKIAVSIAYIFICYGMYELHSTICAYMTYITLSVLGVPAIVINGDTFLLETYQTLYTPFYVLRYNLFWKSKEDEKEAAKNSFKENEEGQMELF